jgi:hypothetical protein
VVWRVLRIGKDWRVKMIAIVVFLMVSESDDVDPVVLTLRADHDYSNVHCMSLGPDCSSCVLLMILRGDVCV